MFRTNCITARVNCPYRWIAAALTALVAIGQTGCVERRMIVRSNPPGAMLYVDDYPIGATPVATDFIYYGTRKIRLVKDGYETLVVSQPVPAPWYQYFPIDFVTENLVPGQIRDTRMLNYNMLPAVQVSTDQLMSRAEPVRRSVQTNPTGAPIAPGTVPSTQILSPPGILPPAENIPAPSGPLPAPSGTLPPPSGSQPGAPPTLLPPPAGTYPPAPGAPNYLGPR